MGVQARWTVPRRRLGDCEQAARIRSAKGPGAPSPRPGRLDSEMPGRAVVTDNAQERMADVPLAFLGPILATGDAAGPANVAEATTVVAKPTRGFLGIGIELVPIRAPSPDHDEVSGWVVSMLHGCIRGVEGSGRLRVHRHALQRR